MNCNVRNVVVLSIATLCLVGCGGGRVVVLPSTPAPSAFVATTSSAPDAVATMPAARVSPGADYVWIAGHYHFQVDHYTLVPGQWVLAPYPGAVWVPARWEPRANGYYWVPGHWQ
jgi:YXWGXW repeat-containing protein